METEKESKGEARNKKHVMKSVFDGLIRVAKEWINKIRNISILQLSITKMQRKKGMKKMEQTIQELWDDYKRYNISIIRIREEKDKKDQKK